MGSQEVEMVSVDFLRELVFSGGARWRSETFVLGWLMQAHAYLGAV